MKRPTFFTLATLAAGALIWSGLASVRDTLSTGAWLKNPLGFTSAARATGPVVLDQVQALQRLETCRYNGQVVVRGDTSGWVPSWLAGDKILFVGRGEVVAGVDLRSLQSHDVRVEGEQVVVRLPEPQIFHSRLDNHGSQVFERQTGLFSKADSQLETRVRQEAEERIRSAAMESGVLATARENAQSALRQQLSLLGFREVRFL
ncbi:MAG: DUF4230 domain-containing protein [Armatimonadota bacterium]